MKRILNLIITLIFFNACATKTQTPKSQLEIREFQTRYFEVNDKNILTKAIVNTLLDEGYIIKNANTELGIITGEKGGDVKEKVKEDSQTNPWGLLIVGALIIITLGIILLVSKDKDNSGGNNNSGSGSSSSEQTYEKTKIIETTISISEFSNGYKVRAVFQRKILDNKGNIVRVEQIQDANFYQEFFSKLDKSIFLQKELESK
ncbi:MAG: hypothetical protein ABIL49_00150 [candidate division WOR-3 bacterium]|jgi:hypothetical protein